MSEVKEQPKKLLSLDDIVETQDVQYTEVEVPEWGGVVRFGSLDAGSLIDFIEANEGPTKRTAGLRLIVKSIVDADGKRIGNDKYLEQLKRKNAAVCGRLVDKILVLNGIDSKKTAEATKNASSEVSSDASPTVLH